MTDRTTPVRQPRTARDLVDELDALLAAAEVPKPYVLVGHSLGGLIVQLYARLHPDQIHGVVFVDPFSATIPARFGPLWPIYRDELLNPPIDQMPLPAMRAPDSERVDLDASSTQTLSAPPLPPRPLVVLTKSEPFAGLKSVPGLSADDVNRNYALAQDAVVALRRQHHRSSPRAAITTSNSPSLTWLSARPNLLFAASGNALGTHSS